MEQLIEVNDSAHYEGYDSLTSVQWCTPTYLGFGACIGATAKDGYLILKVTGVTPIGRYSKSFKITKDVSFSWSPISRIKISLDIKNFKDEGGYFSFDLSAKICGKIPYFGWKCAGYSHHFSIPDDDNQKQLETLSDSDFSSFLAVKSSLPK